MAVCAGAYRGAVSAQRDGELTSPSEELFASAREVRRRAHDTVLRSQDIRRHSEDIWQAPQQACARTKQLRQLWLSGSPIGCGIRPRPG